MSELLSGLIGLYYVFVLVFIGIGGTLDAIYSYDILSKGMLKTIFMYQYAVYQLAKEHINLAGIIILEIITTLSVWPLNIIVLIAWCLYHVAVAVCKAFYCVFKKK